MLFKYRFNRLTGGLLRITLATLLLISLFGSSVSMLRSAQAADPWWDASWSYRKTITINETKVVEDLSNFPVLIDITDSDLASKALPSGNDIAFADNSGNQLDHEIEFFNDTTGELVAWVELPNLQSTQNTTFYMYYGNALASSQENMEAVWGSDYVLVQHLEETSGVHIDSTSNDNDGTPMGVMDQDGVGKINGANVFDGGNDYISINHSSSISGFSQALTISAWIRIQNTTKRIHTIATKYNATSSNRSYSFTFENHSTYGNVLGLYASTNGLNVEVWYANFTFVNNTWYHASVVWYSNALPTFYINGAPLTNIAGTGTIPSLYDNVGTPLWIGATQFATGREFDGIIDEVRLSSQNKSASWLNTEYENQNNPSAFYTLGSEGTGGFYPIIASSNTGGSISPSGTVNVDDGGNKTFYIIPDDGYVVSDVVVDSNISLGTVYSYTFTNVRENHTIKAWFNSSTPPPISFNKASYKKGQTVQITVTGGTVDQPVMLQIKNKKGKVVWAAQGTFDGSGQYQTSVKIPSSHVDWGYGYYPVTVKDVFVGSIRTKSFSVPSPAPPPPRPPSPPPPVVNDEPVADAGPDQQVFVGRTLYFDGSGSYDSDGTIVNYIWIFGDGLTGGDEKSSHSYSTPGIYEVKLIVIDDDSAAAEDVANVTVIEPPIEPTEGVDDSVEAGAVDHLLNSTEMDCSITLNTTGQVTVTLLEYPENPYPEIPLPNNSLPNILDIAVSNPDGVDWPIYVERHYDESDLGEIDESRLVLYYYRDGAWHVCRETGVNVETNIVWAYMYEDEVTGSPTILAVLPMQATFVFSDLEVSPSEVEPGENVEVSVTISNVGDLEGTYDVVLFIDELVEESESVTLAGGAETTVSFTVVEEEGTHSVEVDGLTDSFTVAVPPEPAEFVLSDLSVSPPEVEPDEDVAVSVTIENIGDLEGTYTINVKLDGIQYITRDVTVNGGSLKTEGFTVSSEESGTHTVSINGLEDDFTVAVPPEPAEFVLSDLSVSPSEVEPGENVEVSVTIRNVGDLEGTYDVVLFIDELVEDSESVTLAGGAETTVSFTVVEEEEGTHSVQIDELSRSFVIESPSGGIPWLWIDLFVIVLAIGALYYARQRKLI